MVVLIMTLGIGLTRSTLVNPENSNRSELININANTPKTTNFINNEKDEHLGSNQESADSNTTISPFNIDDMISQTDQNKNIERGLPRGLLNYTSVNIDVNSIYEDIELHVQEDLMKKERPSKFVSQWNLGDYVYSVTADIIKLNLENVYIVSEDGSTELVELEPIYKLVNIIDENKTNSFIISRDYFSGSLHIDGNQYAIQKNFKNNAPPINDFRHIMYNENFVLNDGNLSHGHDVAPVTDEKPQTSTLGRITLSNHKDAYMVMAGTSSFKAIHGSYANGIAALWNLFEGGGGDNMHSTMDSNIYLTIQYQSAFLWNSGGPSSTDSCTLKDQFRDFINSRDPSDPAADPSFGWIASGHNLDTFGCARKGSLATNQAFGSIQALGSPDRQERSSLTHETGHIFIECISPCDHHGAYDYELSYPGCGWFSEYIKYEFTTMNTPYVNFKIGWPVCQWQVRIFEFSDANTDGMNILILARLS